LIESTEKEQVNHFLREGRVFTRRIFMLDEEASFWGLGGGGGKKKKYVQQG